MQEKKDFSIILLEQADICVKKKTQKTFNSYLISLNKKVKIIKLPEENIMEYFQNLELGKDFLPMIPKALIIKKN